MICGVRYLLIVENNIHKQNAEVRYKKNVKNI